MAARKITKNRKTTKKRIRAPKKTTSVQKPLDPMQTLYDAANAIPNKNILLTKGFSKLKIKGEYDVVILAEALKSFSRFVTVYASGILLQAEGENNGKGGKKKKKKLTEDAAKKALKAFLDALKKKIDKTNIDKKTKKKLKRKIDKAKRKIDECEDDELKEARALLNEVYNELCKKKDAEKKKAEKKKIGDAKTDAGIASSLIIMILLKRNWNPGWGFGVKDVEIKTVKGKCVIFVSISGADDISMSIKKKFCKNKKEKAKAKKIINGIKKKFNNCEYPNKADAKNIWDMIDP